LILANNCQNLGYGQAHNFDLRKFVGSTTGNLRHAKSGKFRFELLELTKQFSLALRTKFVYLETSCEILLWIAR
jgi:hypothetical protein